MLISDEKVDKGEHTKRRILSAGMDFVCRYGLANISIGKVAKRMNMSRTGVISHFANKADMQIAILQYCESVFISQVIQPSLHLDPVINLRQFYHHWMNWVFTLSQQQSMTCPFVKAVAEFQDRPNCIVKTLICEQQASSLRYIISLVQRCINKNHFKPTLNSEEFALNSLGAYLSHNINRNLLENKKADLLFIKQIDTLITQASIER